MVSGATHGAPVAYPEKFPVGDDISLADALPRLGDTAQAMPDAVAGQ
jgi:hypothetical protein